jgi:Succinylglutamate desuccinylase / Aspartoacylase family
MTAAEETRGEPTQPPMDLAALRKVFDRLMGARHLGVAGAWSLDGLAPGRTLGLSILTHGNEPSGLAAAAEVLAMADGGWRPACGSVVLTVNNPAATERWFAAVDAAGRLAARFVDTDMNRLPATLDPAASAYEERRAIELLPVWESFDVALDIHSVGQESPPMIVEGYGDSRALTRNFPIEIVIRNIAEVQIGAPAFAFYGKPVPQARRFSSERPRACVSFEIETGWHESAEALGRAVACTRLLLQALGMVPDDAAAPAPPASVRRVYEVAGSLMVPNGDYRLTRMFPTFEPCRAGDIIAVGPGPGRTGLGAALAAPCDGHVIFAPRSLTPPNPRGEVLFFTRPVILED